MNEEVTVEGLSWKTISGLLVITRPFTVAGRRTRLGQGVTEQENDSVIMEESSCDSVELRKKDKCHSQVLSWIVFLYSSF
jgi:hypothetical protein